MATLDNTALEGRATSLPRVPVIDIARGLAVVAMVIYHFAWDLSTLALANFQVVGSPGWNLFARAIAASFLVLAGIGISMSYRDGIRWPHFLRRLAVIAAAAAVITAATVFSFPRSYIFFGILHNMALSSVIALPFLFAPRIVAALAALAFLALPRLVSGGLFDQPLLAFLGLGTIAPNTYDWVPVFPWTGYVLAGFAVAPLLTSLLPKGEGGSLGRGLATLGRYSLVIYLLHQPVLFGALFGLRQLTGPNPAADAAPFMRYCSQSCETQNQPQDLCKKACGCTVQALRRDGIWNAIRDGDPSAEFLQRAGNRAAECLKQSRGN